MTTAGPPERDTLLARIDALERAAEHKPSPLWKNTALVGLIGTLVAVIPSSLTAIREYYQTEREVRLSLVRYQHERTLSYLDRALNPDTAEAKQAQVFRFLQHLPKDDPVRQWADDELTIVEQSIVGIQQQVDGKEKLLAQLELEKQAVIDETTAVLEAPAVEEEEVETALQVAQLETSHLDRKIDKIQQEAVNLKVRAGDAPSPEAAVGATVVLAPPRHPSYWRLQIASASTIEKAQAKAAQAKAAGAANPSIYRKRSLFHVLIGRYGSKQDAGTASTTVSGYVGSGVRPVDVMVWCSTQKPRDGYIECS